MAKKAEEIELKYATVETVNKIREQLANEDELYDLAELFKVFGDSTRIKILFVLYSGEMCVYDIANTLNMSQSSISHHLKSLKQNRLVKFRKDGKATFYSLADEHVFSIMEQGLEHVTE
ncbi:MAG: metalloregulator ArsR/SmtB family transcription factor [Lachnospiraceae bacterium]|nr:metalloregulator ArsR/SmtB family transcription factor [Lachnospiraceae bacterium]